MHGAQRPNLERLDAVDHVLDGAGWRGEMEDVIDFAAIKRTVNVELLEFECTIAAEVLNVRHPPGQEVVDSHHGITLCEQGIAKMGAEKAGTSCYQCARLH